MPSRSYSLISPEFNLHLHTLNSENEPTTSSSSSSSLSVSSIAKKLHNLESLYDCVDNFLLLPRTQQIFTRERHEKWVEQILDGYLSLVDTCAIARDFIYQSKEYIANLLSILRRKDDSSEFTHSIKSFKKQIQKSLRNINMGSFKIKKSSVSAEEDKDQEAINAIISMLEETFRITFALLENLLSSISRTKGNRWSLVSRLVMGSSRKVLCQEHGKSSTFDFGDLDVALRKGIIRVEELQGKLRAMDSIIREVEERLEWLFKRLIKSRVSLLNLQSQYF
ncbi:Arabidopsis protein of unknown function (DUF241 [Striga hermonthica]|uniref:Uncharacterized protein n=1 Tax=Striga hermonthica TaxID=68872 RepID=A0A9N7RI28_STRHE|nr:Arabidopsis protein of unknown function (DUF241 [Striga hermonthica]